MRISLIHPSRGRASKAKQTFDYWRKQATGVIDIEHVLSIDNSDKEIDKYKQLFNSGNIIFNDTEDVVSATNKAAKVASGQILVYLSDDFKCPRGWNESLEDKFAGPNSPCLIKVDDCLQKYTVAVLTIPIMNRALYDRLGYFWYPEYKSMFVDEDLYWTCVNNNWILFTPSLKFPHEHPCNGKAENDEIYKRSASNWDEGKDVFYKRKKLNFPLQ